MLSCWMHGRSLCLYSLLPQMGFGSCWAVTVDEGWQLWWNGGIPLIGSWASASTTMVASTSCQIRVAIMAATLAGSSRSWEEWWTIGDRHTAGPKAVNRKLGAKGAWNSGLWYRCIHSFGSRINTGVHRQVGTMIWLSMRQFLQVTSDLVEEFASLLSV